MSELSCVTPEKTRLGYFYDLKRKNVAFGRRGDIFFRSHPFYHLVYFSVICSMHVNDLRGSIIFFFQYFNNFIFFLFDDLLKVFFNKPLKTSPVSGGTNDFQKGEDFLRKYTPMLPDLTLINSYSNLFFHFLFNPIPAEVLENQDTLGGGQFDPPPSKSHV